MLLCWPPGNRIPSRKHEIKSKASLGEQKPKTERFIRFRPNPSGIFPIFLADRFQFRMGVSHWIHSYSHSSKKKIVSYLLCTTIFIQIYVYLHLFRVLNTIS